MRVANLLVLGAAAMLVWACASTDLSQNATPGGQTSANDCAVIAAVAKGHYQFGDGNTPPPLKALGEPAWKPTCDWSAQGLALTDYVDPGPTANPRERLKWVAFGRPAYDGKGAVVATEIMHGPLAGIGYECRVLSGIAGWTVGECKTSWVS